MSLKRQDLFHDLRGVEMIAYVRWFGLFYQTNMSIIHIPCVRWSAIFIVPKIWQSHWDRSSGLLMIWKGFHLRAL